MQATPEQEARVLKKIDRLYENPMNLIELPMMEFCYMLHYADNVSVGYSTQLGLVKDLVALLFALETLETNLTLHEDLIGTDYSWASSVFCFSYLFWSLAKLLSRYELPTR